VSHDLQVSVAPRGARIVRDGSWRLGIGARLRQAKPRLSHRARSRPKRGSGTLQGMWYDRFDTPIGPLAVAADVEGLRHVLFASNRYEVHGQAAWLHSPARLAEARRQLLEYFEGERRAFELPLRPAGTAFQLKAWLALAAIPYGETRSYAQQAQAIGAPDAVRAVGAANGRNPLPIILPCHRVIGADGGLTGFGGGLPVKAALLRLEGALAPAEVAPRTGDLFG
jgi:methylated-DNA-[protein]-cysteine S-methyltransferase